MATGTIKKELASLFGNYVDLSATAPVPSATGSENRKDVTVSQATGQTTVMVRTTAAGGLVLRDGVESFALVNQNNSAWIFTMSFTWYASLGLLRYYVVDKGTNRNWTDYVPAGLYFS